MALPMLCVPATSFDCDEITYLQNKTTDRSIKHDASELNRLRYLGSLDLH